jgi:rhodanese-related sulfurtransferase
MFGFGLKTKCKEMEPAQVQAELAAGRIHLVDVREENEWRMQRIAGAIHAPLSGLMRAAAQLPDDKPVILYCLSGARSAQAVSLLQGLGLPHDTHMRGGISAWHRSGLPITQ